MADLHLQLLGRPMVRSSRSAAPEPVPPSLQPLFAFLTLAGDAGCHRSRLIDSLWPDLPSDHARRRLNTAVWRSRNLFGVDHAEAIVATRSGHIALDATIVAVDVAPMVQALGDEGRAAAARAEPAALDLLRRAVRIDASQLLAGNDDEWVVQARHHMELAVLNGVATLLAVAAHADEAIGWAELLVRLDPLREDAHRQLIRLYAEAGRRADALRQYDRCVRHLRDDLGVEPLVETTLVATAVRQGIAPPPPDAPDARRALCELREALVSCQVAVEHIESALASLPPG
ncbi:MAG TPA: BTAD domain-containing putative transcriptional regulator [Iamia sp.]